MKMNGARILVEELIHQGVEVIFGYPGGAILNVYDALYEYKDEITHVLTSHEQVHPMLLTVMQERPER